ncbi:MAG: FtsX-like permease family protein [Bacteroidales bacterium]
MRSVFLTNLSIYVTSITLIIISLAIVVQYKYMITYDTGYTKNCILTTRFSANMIKQQEGITHKLKQVPDIIDVAYSSNSLIADNPMWGLQYNGKMIVPYFLFVSDNFPTLMNINILEGRNFTMEDGTGAGKYIFNETAMKEFSIKVGDPIQNHNRNMTAQVIGIAKDFNFKPLYYPIEPFALYVSGESMWELSYAYIKVNNNNLAAIINHIRTTLLEYDNSVASTLKLEFLDQSIGNLYQKEKNLSFMISAFGILAVIISIIGTIGMIYFETRYRCKEIGIRKVFGATILDILWMFNKKYIAIILISFIIATPIAYFVIEQWQSNFTYKAPFSLWIYLIALCLLLVITTIDVTAQSMIAAHQNPAKSIVK